MTTQAQVSAESLLREYGQAWIDYRKRTHELQASARERGDEEWNDTHDGEGWYRIKELEVLLMHMGMELARCSSPTRNIGAGDVVRLTDAREGEVIAILPVADLMQPPIPYATALIRFGDGYHEHHRVDALTIVRPRQK